MGKISKFIVFNIYLSKALKAKYKVSVLLRDWLQGILPQVILLLHITLLILFVFYYI